MKVLVHTVLLLVTIWAHASVAAGPAERQLVLWSEEPMKVLACMPLETGAPFYLEFINSIYLAPVRETLVYTDADGVSIIRVESPSAGVFEYYGLEPDSSGSADLNRSIGRIRIRSSSYENHRVTAGGKTIRLKEIAEGGQPVIVEVRPNGADCGQ